jgi:hypothetical protein
VIVLAAWAKAFVLTILVELLLGDRLLRSTEPSRPRRLAAIALANLSTHPAIWFILPLLELRHASMLLVAETWATVVEMCAYRLTFVPITTLRALAVSALLNGASVAVGALVRAATGWV